MADRAGGNFLTIVARQYYEKLAKGGERGGPILKTSAVRVVAAAALRPSRPAFGAANSTKGDPVNRERLYPRPRLRPFPGRAGVGGAPAT